MGSVDLMQPLSSLIPGVHADVLTVLAASEMPMTGRHIALLARRGTRPAVQAVLDRLLENGLVDAQRAGSATLYALNRDHVLISAVLEAAMVRGVLVDRLRDQITGWAVPAVHSSIFGSSARGEAGPGSDVDILVVRPEGVLGDDETWATQLSELETGCVRWTGNPLSWFETTAEALLAASVADEPLISSLKTDSVHLTGVRLAHLVAPATGRESVAAR